MLGPRRIDAVSPTVLLDQAERDGLRIPREVVWVRLEIVSERDHVMLLCQRCSCREPATMEPVSLPVPTVLEDCRVALRRHKYADGDSEPGSRRLKNFRLIHVYLGQCLGCLAIYWSETPAAS